MNRMMKRKEVKKMTDVRNMNITDEALEDVVGGGGDYFPEIPYYTEDHILRFIALYNRCDAALPHIITSLQRSNSNINPDVIEAYVRENWEHPSNRYDYLEANHLI